MPISAQEERQMQREILASALSIEIEEADRERDRTIYAAKLANVIVQAMIAYEETGCSTKA